ncbi:MAG: hypothetical protein WDM91_12580 [Rhizomicrobium sp.]
MAQFYLNVRDGEDLIRDPVAYHFSTAQAARDAAVKIVRELIADNPDEFDRKQIEIADATGHAVSVVSIHDVMPVRYH